MNLYFANILILCILLLNKGEVQKDMNNLSSFYKEKFDSFLFYLSKAKEMNVEDIHKLRVDIKNIRSLLLLANDLGVEEKLIAKILKQVRPVFKYSGRLRLIQVCKTIVEQDNITGHKKIIESLEENKLQVGKDLNGLVGKFKIDKFQKRVENLGVALSKINKSEIREAADKIIHDELDLIYKLWASSRGEENYHEIRKFFKIIKSILNLLLSLNSDAKLANEFSIVNETESILGNWHDRDVLEQKLGTIQAMAPNSEFKSLVREIKNKNRSEKNILSKKFKQQMLTHFLKY